MSSSINKQVYININILDGIDEYYVRNYLL